jgi:hypothetical protein
MTMGKEKKPQDKKKGIKELSNEDLAKEYNFLNKDRDDLVDFDEYDFDDE